VATANAALYVGARPVFADIEEGSLNLDPASVEAAITDRTRAVVAVHYAGRSCDMDELRCICDRRKVLLIEDASHALGACYRGKPVGSGPADLSTWSFHPVKHIAAGEGGAVSSPVSSETIETVRRLRNHGIDRDARTRHGPQAAWAYEIPRLGYNYRLTDIGAALAGSQLRRLDENLARRREIASYYAQRLAGIGELRLPPKDDSDYLSAWHLYIVRLRLDRLTVGREDVFKALRAENIGVNVHYIPVYRHKLYAEMGYDGKATPVAEEAYEEMLTLPIFGVMTSQDACDVVTAIEKVLEAYRKG
jgi:dTDP-4-amino-4,6-dideoxygalactose transaminase